MRKWYVAATALVTAIPLALGGCGGSDSGSDSSGDKVLTLWHFEDPTAATAIAWNEAIKVFESETGAKVKFEAKSFEQIRSSASQVLNSKEAPDILEYPKGNATAGLLSSQGLLTDLTPQVEKFHWDTTITGSLATTSRYDDKGIMGSGAWYGVTNYGEFVQVYYNKDLFTKHGVEVPTTFDGFVAALQKFKGAGVTPLAVAGGEYPLGQLFYQLALTKADRAWVDAYQLYKGAVDWHGPQLTFAAGTLKDWIDKGYVDKNATALKAQDMENAFVAGKNPIMVSGSWWQGTIAKDATFQWGTALFPGSEMGMGSGGNLWVVPTNSQDKELAYKFIDITLRPAIQNILGDKGSVPVNADLNAIKDPKSKQLIQNFKTLNDRNGLAFYPDWPTPTFYDQLVAATQGLMTGTLSPDAMLTQLGGQYDAGVKSITK